MVATRPRRAAPARNVKAWWNTPPTTASSHTNPFAFWFAVHGETENIDSSRLWLLAWRAFTNALYGFNLTTSTTA